MIVMTVLHKHRFTPCLRFWIALSVDVLRKIPEKTFCREFLSRAEHVNPRSEIVNGHDHHHHIHADMFTTRSVIEVKAGGVPKSSLSHPQTAPEPFQGRPIIIITIIIITIITIITTITHILKSRIVPPGPSNSARGNNLESLYLDIDFSECSHILKCRIVPPGLWNSDRENNLESL